MSILFLSLFLISVVLLITGLFSPKSSLFWYKKERTKKLSALIYGPALIVFFILFGSSLPDASVDQTVASKNLITALTQHQTDSIKQANLEERKKITYSASQLVSYYTQNEVSADNSFKDKNFYVVGYIDKIGKNFDNDTYVALRSGDFLRKVQCFVSDEDVLAKLSPGEKITIYGTGGGMMMNVLMQNCNVVDNLPEQ